MVEDDAITVNAAASLARLEEIVVRRDTIVAEETAVFGGMRPALIVSDIPFLAGDVSEATGVPCVAISNFSWDWICERLFGDNSQLAAKYAGLMPVMRSSYSKMRLALRLPFGGLSDAFRQVIDVPLVTPGAPSDRKAVLSRIRLDPGDKRPVVLLGMRGGMTDATIAAAAADSPDFLLIYPDHLSARFNDWPANVRGIPLGPELDFTDLLGISDIVVTKLGYGTVAECIAAGVRILWPPRLNFREDEAMRVEVPRYLPAREISREDFRSGRWGAASAYFPRSGRRKSGSVPTAPKSPRCTWTGQCPGCSIDWIDEWASDISMISGSPQGTHGSTALYVN